MCRQHAAGFVCLIVTVAFVALGADDSAAVVWTAPEDWQFDPQEPLAGLGHAHADGFNALFFDASVHFLTPTIDPDLFGRLLTVYGKETIRDFHK